MLPFVPAPIVTVVVPASELPITVFCVPAALMFVGPSTVIVVADVPIATAPVLVPVLMLVVNAPPLSLIVVLPSAFSVPSTFVVVAAPPIESVLVPLPVLGESSQQAVLAIDCLSTTDPEQARRALLGGLDARSLPLPKDGCGQAEAQRALIAAQILGVQGTPYLIAPDGRLRQGLPEDLGAWLAQGEGTR